jgi:hypothetical protein
MEGRGRSERREGGKEGRREGGKEERREGGKEGGGRRERKEDQDLQSNSDFGKIGRTWIHPNFHRGTQKSGGDGTEKKNVTRTGQLGFKSQYVPSCSTSLFLASSSSLVFVTPPSPLALLIHTENIVAMLGLGMEEIFISYFEDLDDVVCQATRGLANLSTEPGTAFFSRNKNANFSAWFLF